MLSPVCMDRPGRFWIGLVVSLGIAGGMWLGAILAAWGLSRLAGSVLGN